MKRLRLLVVLGLVTASLALVHAAPPLYAPQGSVDVTPANPVLTAVDPLVYAGPSEVLPPRPFLYMVDKNGITITRFNDNKVVSQYPTASPTLPGGEVLVF
jgi:hypothetical protein